MVCNKLLKDMFYKAQEKNAPCQMEHNLRVDFIKGIKSTKMTILCSLIFYRFIAQHVYDSVRKILVSSNSKFLILIDLVT